MNTNKTRDEIDDKYKWDLSVLYASDDSWEEDYRKVEKELPQLLEFRGTLDDSRKLEQFLQVYIDFSIVKENLYVYANVRFFEDTRNTTYEEMKGRIELLVSKISAETVFIKKELSSLSEKEINKLIVKILSCQGIVSSWMAMPDTTHIFFLKRQRPYWQNWE